MLNALIVDDEPLARKRLRRLLAPMVEAKRLQIVGEAGDGVDALAQLDVHDVDVLFLDIQMPEMGGFDLLEAIAPPDRPEVVFITAYDEYALRAFDASALDYLLKPVTEERLEEAVARVEKAQQSPALQHLTGERLARLLEWVDAQAEEDASPPSPGKDYTRQLSVSYRDRIRIIPVEHIVAIEINEGITRLFALEEDEPGRRSIRQHVVDYTLDFLETNLDPEDFMRVHRSAIVQLNHIREMIPWFSGRYKLVLTGEHEVIASRERSKILKDRLVL